MTTTGVARPVSPETLLALLVVVQLAVAELPASCSHSQTVWHSSHFHPHHEPVNPKVLSAVAVVVAAARRCCGQAGGPAGSRDAPVGPERARSLGRARTTGAEMGAYLQAAGMPPATAAPSSAPPVVLVSYLKSYYFSR